MTLKSINPSTGEIINEYNEMTLKEVNDILEKSNKAFLSWRKKSFSERSGMMKKSADILLNNRDKYATLMAKEMGKPIKQGRAEIEKCAWVCNYYANNTENFLQQEIIKTEISKSLVTFQPLGVIIAVMPWNFPFWQVFRFIAPTLMAGNACILKHASNVSGCALAIEDIIQRANFPRDIFRTLLVNNNKIEEILENPIIKAATLTGSTPAGRAIASKAGEMIKKTVLELGGSDPYLILEDADIDSAVTECIASKLINSGQSCISAKRFIIDKAVREPFEKLFVQKMRDVVHGNPMEESTKLGPLARHDIRDNLHTQVLDSIEKGAKCLLGGTIPEGKGFYYPPTVLTDVKKGMHAYNEELFGPVASIIPVNNEKEAIRVANDSPFGLGAAVFTNDVIKGERIAINELDAGCCSVNTHIKSDPRLPFGGIKESGYGRELSHQGVKEFINIKTILVK